MAVSPEFDLDLEFRTRRRTLWALAYRITGSAAEADDLVQDAFVRVLESPPTSAGETLLCTSGQAPLPPDLILKAGVQSKRPSC